jgi:hypothetical protein
MKRSKRSPRVGTRVKSHYRATWTGLVVASGRDHHEAWVTRSDEAIEPVYGRDAEGQWIGPRHPDGHTPIHHISNEGCVLVKVTHDRNGHPMRKVLYKTLHSNWLRVVEKQITDSA